MSGYLITSYSLTKFDTTGWTFYDLSSSKFKGSYTGKLFRDSKNNLWLNSDIMIEIKDNNWIYHYPQNNHVEIMRFNSINEDSFGNLWLGSYAHGLIKYDGAEWISINTDNSNITTNNVGDIEFDQKGNIWFVTDWEAGITKYDGSTFTIYDTTNSGLPSNRISNIEIDSKGNLWIGTMYEGLVKYDFDNWTVYSDNIKGNPIYDLHLDENDVIWIGGAGLLSFKDEELKHYIYDDSIDYHMNYVTNITEDFDNNIWLSTTYCLYKFDGHHFQKFDHKNSGLPDQVLGDIEFDEYGNLWIGGGLGVTVYKEGGIVTEALENEMSLSSNFKLSQNYPNPFNPSTTIKYSIQLNERRETKNVKLLVYDILGREVTTLVNEEQKSGNYEVIWNAINQPSGIYFYQLTSGNYTTTKKMLLIK